MTYSLPPADIIPTFFCVVFRKLFLPIHHMEAHALTVRMIERYVYVCMYVCMYVYFDSVVHYTSYVNNVRQIKQIQIHPEPRQTPESLEDCGWVLSYSGWPMSPTLSLLPGQSQCYWDRVPE